MSLLNTIKRMPVSRAIAVALLNRIVYHSKNPITNEDIAPLLAKLEDVKVDADAAVQTVQGVSAMANATVSQVDVQAPEVINVDIAIEQSVSVDTPVKALTVAERIAQAASRGA